MKSYCEHCNDETYHGVHGCVNCFPNQPWPSDEKPDYLCNSCGQPDCECCPECGADVEEGCIHYSPCCGVSVLFGSDCCSDCKEHTSHVNC